MNHKRLILSLFAVLLLATGCTTDYHYANSFIRKHRHAGKSATETFYVCLPNSVMHTNSSLNDVPDFYLLSFEEQDSVIASKTDILNRLDDSIFLSQFNGMFLYTLSRLKVPVVVVKDPSLLPHADDNHLVINFVQFEAEEYVQPSRSSFYTKRGYYYAYDYDLRHFSLNAWLQFAPPTDTNATVFFKNEERSEGFQGTVIALKEDHATLKTNFTRIDVNDAYQLARDMGRECATLYIERMLTEYVCRKKGTNGSYFYYNPQSNRIDVIMPYEDGIKENFERL